MSASNTTSLFKLSLADICPAVVTASSSGASVNGEDDQVGNGRLAVNPVTGSNTRASAGDALRRFTNLLSFATTGA